MADTVKVELGGKSKYEVAMQMAHHVIALENRTATKQEFLYTVYECLRVLESHNPSPAAKPKGF